MANGKVALVYAPGDGHIITLGSSSFTLKVTGENSNGAYAIMEYVAPPGAGSPMHCHTREDESFQILQGTMTFHLGDEPIEARTGSFVYIPRGLRHAFVNQTQEPVRALIIATPAGLERYFQEIADLSAAGVTDAASYQAVNEKYGLEFETT